MKRLLFITLIALGTVCHGQQKKDSVQAKPDSATIIMTEFLQFLEDKITVKQFIPISEAVNAYLKQREFLKPKNK